MMSDTELVAAIRNIVYTSILELEDLPVSTAAQLVTHERLIASGRKFLTKLNDMHATMLHERGEDEPERVYQPSPAFDDARRGLH